MRYKLYGIVAIALLAAAGAGTVGAYQQVFTPAVWGTVQADRSGLLMDPGADVTVRGVTVGKVRQVQSDGDGAELTIALQPDQVSLIPANVTAQISAPTVFGAKFVELVPPADPSTQPITDGAIIQPTRLHAEMNDVFENLVSLLQSVDVAKLNASLGALSTALQGRGYEAGELVQQLNTYLQGLQPSVPALGRDISLLADVSNVYADATPDLLATANNAAGISNTLVAEQIPLQAFLLDISGLADNARGFLGDNAEGIHDSLATLAPVTALTAEYAPGFPCLFASVNKARRSLEPIVGGGQPGLHILAMVLPGQQPYEYPRNLPKVGLSDGPSCYGGPVTAETSPVPSVKFDDGSEPFNSSSDALSVGNPPLAVQLFGPAAQQVLGGAQ